MRSGIPRYFSFKTILEWTLRRPLAVISIILAITFFFAWQIRYLSIKTSIYDLEVENLDETTRYQELKKIFGSDEIIRVVIKAENVFDPATFRKIEQLADAAAKIDGIRRVISLPDTRRAVDASGSWKMKKFYTVVSHIDVLDKNLFSADRKATALTLVLRNDADPDAVVQRVREMIAGASRELSIYQFGMPLVSEALVKFTEKDFFRLPPLTFLFIALILFAVFRKLKYVLIPLVCIGLALTWTFGLMAFFRVPLSMLTMIVPVFLIAVGTAYCLHIIAEYQVCRQDAASAVEATRSTFSYTVIPTSLAVLTTIIGLGSLLVNRIAAIREFAIFSCFGMFSSLVILLTFLPASLLLIPLRAGTLDPRLQTHRLFNRFIDKIIDLDLNRQKMTFTIMGVLVVICLAGILRIKVETNPMSYFKEETAVKRQFNDIYRSLSGSFPIHVVMAGKEVGYFEDPGHVADIARLQKFLETLPGVDKTMSFADYMKLVNYALNHFEPQFYALPQEAFEVRMLINNYTTLLGEDMLKGFMSEDFSRTNIILLTHMSSSREFLKTREKILAFVDRNFSRDLAWQVSGLGMVISASSHFITSGQIKSLSITMVLVFGIMFILFLSSKVGLIAIAPNIFPIIINFGIMGWLGIELSVATSLIASVAIGLAVDDTIHYLARYNREFKKDLDDRRAIKETLRRVGRPMIFTTLTICVGFSILLFSNFKPTAIFGLMMLITSLSALAGDLILLPSLIQHIELVTLWDLVRLKLGREPREGIPLFKGLSRTQVHYIIMAGSLKKIEAGEALFHKGDSSDSMYAVICGAVDVLDSVRDRETGRNVGNPVLINALKTGDVLGEMGFLRSVPRSATVVATEPTELLQINWKMMKRLQWLYPPTAHQFFFNLMSLICDRLDRLTRRFSEIKALEGSK